MLNGWLLGVKLSSIEKTGTSSASGVVLGSKVSPQIKNRKTRMLEAWFLGAKLPSQKKREA